MSIAPRPQLLTYPDSLGGDLATLGALLAGPLSGLFHGVHILPPFPSSADRGFAPLTYGEIDPRFGTWHDIERIAESHDVLLDVMINHLSRQSAEFQDFQRRGRHSPHADLFITVDKVWPDGDPPAADIAKIFLRKPDSPFSTVTIGATGATERVWTSFGTADWSEQIDLDVTAPATRALISEWLRVLASHGVRIVRLDAVGYVTKKAGTSCFMVEPEIYEFLEWITGVADTFTADPPAGSARPLLDTSTAFSARLLDLRLRPSGHGSRRPLHREGESARRAPRWSTCQAVHDARLPRRDPGATRPRRTPRARCAPRSRRAHRRPRRQSEPHSCRPSTRPNSTYTNSTARTTRRSTATTTAISPPAQSSCSPEESRRSTTSGCSPARTISPRSNATGEGRAINRHDYTTDELLHAFDRPVVKRLIELIRLRNTHPAFDGSLHVENANANTLQMHWRCMDTSCTLRVDLRTGQFSIDEGAD